MPTWLLKASIDVLAPFIVLLLTTSLESGEFPSAWKHAVVYPRLKQPGLDQTDAASYRPISNLPFLSKLLERIVNRQLIDYLAQNHLLPRDQSAYRQGHSTETAILKIFNDLVDAAANGRLGLLCALDLSAAFDTVDHGILTRRLQSSYGIDDLALLWISDYLKDRTQSIYWNSHLSASRSVLCGVPQGSVLGPLLFVLYVAEVGDIIRSHDLTAHAYADDIQIISSCLPAETEQLATRITACTSEVSRWMASNRLALNPGKSEVLWVCTPRRKQLLSRSPLSIAGIEVTPTTSVRLLGVLLDETLALTDHVNQVARTCYYQLRKIRQLRRHLPTETAILLMRALILSRLDYCNSVLLGLPESQLSRLQTVQNVSARLIFGARWNEHATPLLRDKLHWLRIRERITYKRCWITFRALNDPTCPDYLSSLLHRPTMTGCRLKLRSSTGDRLQVPPPAKTAKYGERTVTRGNPILWNALPDCVSKEKTSAKFANNLKTHLFKTSYECEL